MKKVLSFAVVAALFSVAVSCSHDDYDGPTTVQPADQKALIDSFITAENLTNLTQDTATGSTGLMSYVTTPGNLDRKLNDSIPVVYFKVAGTFLDGTPFYTVGSSDLAVNFLTGAYSSSDAIIFVNASVIYHYLTALGEGGSVTFVTPSAYAFGAQSVSLSTGTIPANTPLYFSQLTIDSIRSK